MSLHEVKRLEDVFHDTSFSAVLRLDGARRSLSLSPAEYWRRNCFVGATFIFYVAVASLIVPGLVLSIGIGLGFQMLGLPTRWYTSALGAHLSWTLPFGLLIILVVVWPQQDRTRCRIILRSFLLLV